jgi:hypothetical protein
VTKHPSNDWRWKESTEIAFQEWFNDFHGSFSLRSEWFFGDCEVGDENTRKDLMYRWLHAAYVAGYNTRSKTDNQ